MRRLVSSAAALEADRAAEAVFGYPPAMLMEEAGIRLQDRLEQLTSDQKLGSVVYLAGSGNNGGDALVMARQAFLRGQSGVTVVAVFPPRSASCQQQDTWIRSLGILRLDWPSEAAKAALASASLWVDGIWGTGLQGPLRPERQAVLVELEALRSSGDKPCVALDVPSGLWDGFAAGEPVLRARWTLSPGWLKDFCFFPAAREAVGVPLAVPMAFPRQAAPSADLVEASDLPALLPQISPQDHKGKRGHVVVLGGSPGMTGALVLAARSAAAAGAGLVSLSIDPELIELVAPQVPAFQVRPTADLATFLPRYDAAVVGPGWGRSPDRIALLRLLWSSDLPLVLDADALAAWGPAELPLRKVPVVITPHPGEFARLGAQPGGTVTSAAALAQQRGVTVVLKGSVTWILGTQGQRAVWDGRNPALGTGGSGDCLAGVVGALLAAGLSGFEAARAAVALHGESGRDLADSEGWFTADRLPEALARRAAACRTAPGPL